MSDLSEAKPVPEHITRVVGCNCGGLNMHLTKCSFWDLDSGEQLANTDQALDRLDAYVAELNAGLRP